jgi:hypothetical protein
MGCKHCSKEKVMSKNILFISGQSIKDRTGISHAVDPKQLAPVIKLAQDMFLQPALGSGLYGRLQDGIDADDLTDEEQTLMDDYIMDVMVWATLSELPLPLSYQFFAKGNLQKGAEESSSPSRNDLDYISGYYKDRAEFYKQRLIKYLKTNYNLFSQYTSPGNGFDTIFPEEDAYECPIYLGTDKKHSYGIPNSGEPSNFTNGVVQHITVTPAAGLTSFTVSQLNGRNLIYVSRGTWQKFPVSAVTADTNELFISGTTVTLPTGDVTNGQEKFYFQYR